MNRKTFDKIASIIGLLLAIFLFVAGGLMQWGYSFANGTVKTQLQAQKIVLPAATGNSEEAASVTAFFKDNGGKMMTTGKQAQMYADHYIAFHIKAIGGGKTYSEVSAAARSNPTDAALQAARTNLFMGETLRGELLNAYAFWQLGQLAMYGAAASFAGGLLFLVLALMGFAHLRRVDAGESI